MPIAGVLPVIILAALVEWLVDPFPINSDFFATSAQIGPVFGLALFVEIAVLAGRGTGRQSINSAAGAALVRVNMLLLLISESAALYAVASGASRPWLLVAVVAPWLIQLFLLSDALYHRVGARRT